MSYPLTINDTESMSRTASDVGCPLMASGRFSRSGCIRSVISESYARRSCRPAAKFFDANSTAYLAPPASPFWRNDFPTSSPAFVMMSVGPAASCWYDCAGTASSAVNTTATRRQPARFGISGNTTGNTGYGVFKIRNEFYICRVWQSVPPRKDAGQVRFGSRPRRAWARHGLCQRRQDSFWARYGAAARLPLLWQIRDWARPSGGLANALPRRAGRGVPHRDEQFVPAAHRDAVLLGGRYAARSGPWPPP